MVIKVIDTLRYLKKLADLLQFALAAGRELTI